MNLATLQRAFQAHLITGNDGIAAFVEPAMQRGLPVYAYAYRATLRAALRDTFEKTLLWLGEDAFDASADTYIGTVPSRSWTLSDYGDGFSAHLAATMPNDPEVGEIAWLDWALRQAFAAGTLSPLDPVALAAVDWEVATLTLAPHLAFRTVGTNVIELWNGLPDAPVSAERLDVPIGLIVWRDGFTPEFRSADPREVEALAMLGSRQSFAATCATLAERGGDAETIGGFLSVWLRDGLVSVDS
jgi:hypothetical protein